MHAQPVMSIGQGFQRYGIIKILGGIAVNGKQLLAAQIQPSCPVLLLDKQRDGIRLLDGFQREGNRNAMLIQDGFRSGIPCQAGTEYFCDNALGQVFFIAAEQYFDGNTVTRMGFADVFLADDNFRQFAGVIPEGCHFSPHDNTADQILPGLVENTEYLTFLVTGFAGWFP